MKKFILTLLLLSCIFNVSCLTSKQADSYFEYYSDEQVNAYFDSIADITQQSNDLISKGFVWASDGLNFTYWTDTFTTPNYTLARKFGNCNDYAALWLSYCVHTKKAQEVIQYAGFKNILKTQWHYWSIIKVDDIYYHQSNISITPILKTDEVMLYWLSKGYIYQVESKKVEIK